MDLQLKNKVAVITGSSRGIGKGIAVMMAEEGCRIVICARTKQDVAVTVEEISRSGGDALGIVCDISRKKAIDDLVEKTLARFGRIDILVNNIGGNRRNLIEDTTEKDWQDIIDLNLMAHVRMSQKVVPLMKKQGSGSVIFISSIFGRELGGPGLSIYNTTKSALISLAKVMAAELAPHGVRVNSIAPGSIRFPGGSWDKRCIEEPEKMAMFIDENLPMGRFGKVEEIASVACFLASERASLVTGSCINVDGGQSRSLI